MCHFRFDLRYCYAIGTNEPMQYRINGGNKMLKCQICTSTTEILAHQIRGRNEVAVCLDCADRYYQDQLTKSLIQSAKVGA